MQNKKLLTVFVFVLLIFGASRASASLIFSTNSITGNNASTIDMGTGNNLFLQTSNGNVGIGTTNPTVKLEVTGGAKFNGYNSAGYSSINDLNTTTDSFGNLNIYTTDTYGIDKGGQITLAGSYRSSGNIMNFGTIAGRKENANDTDGNGYLAFGTTTSSTNTEKMRITSTGMVGIGSVSPNAKLDINSNSFILETPKTPASATAACTTGMISWDTNYVYVCVGTNAWKRSAISTW